MISFSSKFYDQVRQRRDETVETGRSRILSRLGQCEDYDAMVAARIGTMSRLLGDEEAAQEYFRYAASLYWPHDQVALPGLSDDHMLEVGFFGKGAIFAQLSGQLDRAQQLFRWSVERFNMVSPDDLMAWSPRGPLAHHQYGAMMMFAAYAEMRAAQWEHVAEHAAEAIASFDQARKRRVSLLPEYKTLPRVLAMAAAWHEDPSAENAEEAQDALVRVVTVGRNYLEKVAVIPFIWDLSEAMPQLFGAVQIRRK